MLSVNQSRLVRAAVTNKLKEGTAKDSISDTLDVVATPLLLSAPELLVAWKALPTSSKVMIVGAIGVSVYGVVQVARMVTNALSPIFDGVIPDDWNIPVVGPTLKALGLKTTQEAGAVHADSITSIDSSVPTPNQLELSAQEKKSESAPLPDTGANAPSRSVRPSPTVSSTRNVVRPAVKGTNVKITGIGSTVMMSESGGDPGKVSSGRGDAGGVSYGLYQFATNRGTPQQYVAQSEYASDFAGLKAGTKEFSDKWREVAARDPKGFAASQQAYAEAVYYWPVVRAVKTATGYDINAASAGVKEIAFSTSIQYGPIGTKKQPGSAVKFIMALNTLAANPSSADVINAVQGEKAANVSTNFRSSSAAVQASVSQRIERERQIALNNTPDASPTANNSMVASTSNSNTNPSVVDRTVPSIPIKASSKKPAVSDSNTQVAFNDSFNGLSGNPVVPSVIKNSSYYQTDSGILISVPN